MNSEKYLLAIIPPQSVSDFVDSYRRRYDENSLNFIVPHITVYPPFYSSESEPELINKLNNTFNKNIPFRISLDSVDFFTGKNNVAFFKPDLESTDKIKNLLIKTKSDLSDIITNAYPDYPANSEQFIPHCTIAEKIPNAKLPNIRRDLESLSVNQSFNVNSIFLLRKQQEKWLPISEINSSK